MNGGREDNVRPLGEEGASGRDPTSTCPAGTALMTVVVLPTTGGHFELQVSKMDTVDQLKKLVAKRLKLAKERLCLLHKERQLHEGTLLDNNIHEGSKITLLPMVETGLLMQRPEQSVLQALENLNDSQVNDFLSGKAPLNLTMRLGDHMMFIQLQLSTTGTAGGGATSSSSSSSSTRRGLLPPDSSTTSSSPPQCAAALPTPDTSITHVKTFSNGRRLTDVTHLLDTRTLAEASRNLSQTLRQLSSQAVTTTTTTTTTTSNNTTTSSTTPSSSRSDGGEVEECQHHGCPSRRPGAIIESMHHHGKGIYSGTFSGTLNPALQDRNGHPRKHISTIVHILNDLLGASPHYRRQSPRSLDTLTMSLGRSKGAKGGVGTVASSKSEEEITRLSKENMATKGKMEQLQMRLEERRCRRRARREARYAPYAWPPSDARLAMGLTTVDCPGAGCVASSPATPTSPSSDIQMDCDGPNGDLEAGVDTAEYLKMNPGAVMA